MTSSCSISSLAPSFPMKIVPYVPPASKPKPKSKAKSMATTKATVHSRPGVGSSEDDEDWFHIGDFPMPGSNASRSLNPGVPALFGPADASGSLHHDVVGAASELKKPENYQSGRESLDGGTDHATRVAKTNSALNGLFDGSSLECPLILESDATEEHHRTTQVKPGNGASDYQGNGCHAATNIEGYCAGQHGALDAASMCALSEGGIKDICHEPSLAEDEPLVDIDMTSRSPLTGKRRRRLSDDMIISSAEVPDITLEPELEDLRLAKRRRPSERQAESLILDHVPTPKPTSLLTPSGPDSRFRASNEPSASLLENDSQCGGAGSPVLSPNNLDEGNGDGGAHARGVVEELLHSPRQSISPFEGVEGKRNRRGSDNEAGESHEVKLGQVDELFGRPSVKTSQRSKRSDRPVQRRCGLSRTALRRQGRSMIPTRTSRNVTSSQPRQLPRPRMDSATQSCSPQTSSPGTKVGGGANNNHGPSANMAYQITDLTLYVPKGPSIVTAIVRCSEPSLSPNPIDLEHELFRGEGKVIRTMQLSPDSWMLIGYQYGDGALGAITRESPKLLNADWTSSPHSDATSHDIDHPEDGNEGYESGEEGKSEYRPHAAGSSQRFSRDGRRHRRRRTREPWLESDEERLLSYKDKMHMKWNEIFTLFPDRTEDAVKVRYYMLHKKDL